MPATTRLPIATIAVVMICTMAVACSAAKAPSAAGVAEQGAATRAAPTVWAPVVGAGDVPAQPARPTMAAIVIEHVTYTHPQPGILYKMTDAGAGVTCYYTAAGVPACLETPQ